MRTIYIKIFITLLLTVLLISGCSGSKEQTAKLDGIEWKLESLNGKSAMPENAKPVTLLFSKAKSSFTGYSGCNTYYGIYFSGDKNLQLSEISSTKMMCDDMSIEMEYLSALKKIDGYKITDGKLNLTSFGNTVAVFTR